MRFMIKRNTYISSLSIHNSRGISVCWVIYYFRELNRLYVVKSVHGGNKNVVWRVV